MRKVFKSFVGVALALVMCLTMAPTATAKADEAVALSEYTEEQLLTAFMGEWWNTGDETVEMTKDHIKVWDTSVYDEELGKVVEKVYVDTDWTYEGVVELEGRAIDESSWAVMGAETPDNKTKALKFSGGDYTFFLYRGYFGSGRGDGLQLEYDNKAVLLDYKTSPDPYNRTHYVSDALADAVAGKTYEPFFVATPMADTDAEIEDMYWYAETDSIYDEQSGEYIISPVGQYVEISHADDTYEYHYMYATLTEEGYLVEYKVYKYADDSWDEQVLKSGTYYFGGVAEPKAEEPTPAPTETPVEEPTTPVETETPVEESTPVPTETPVEEPKAEEPTETPVEEPTPVPTETPVEEPTETPVEEPKTEEPTETPTVETEEKEIVEKTKDGRAVYTGETVYIVKKGDCLWNIAKQLLGNGARYKELFTRNNGIIEKAKLIFPGQEVIVPAK